jgi:hypothetical protein
VSTPVIERCEALQDTGYTVLKHFTLWNGGKEELSHIKINMITFEKIEKQFELNRNAENARKMAQYMRNQFKFYGLPAP